MTKILKLLITVTLLAFLLLEPVAVSPLANETVNTEETSFSDSDLSSIESEQETSIESTITQPVSEEASQEQAIEDLAGPELVDAEPESSLDSEKVTDVPEEPARQEPEQDVAAEEQTEEPATPELIDEPETSADPVEPLPEEEFIEEPISTEDSPEEGSIEETIEEEQVSVDEQFTENEPLIIEDFSDDVIKETEQVQQQEMTVATSGLVDVGVLTNTSLSASSAHTAACTKTVTLNYEGKSTLNAGVLENAYIIFSLPEELVDLADRGNMTASYDVPRISLLGIELGRNQGNFSNEEIMMNGRQVFINVQSLLTLAVDSTYKFQLNFTIDAFPSSSDLAEYLFHAQVTTQVVDISVLEDDVARTFLSVPPSGTLAIEAPGNLTFTPTPIDFTTKTIYRQQTHADWTIGIMDPRGRGCKWNIQAKAAGPLTSTTSQHTLPTALKYVHPQDGQTYVLGKDLINAYSGVTESDPDTNIVLEENEGPLIQLNTAEALPETYTTAITWILTDAP